ncbi:MAG: isochorismate synthase [Anaerolineae bacterium]|nr:isochorismate synthase [Anaerolineae bacterium]
MLVQETLKSEWVTLLDHAIGRAATSRTPVLVSASKEISAFAPLELLRRAAALSVERAYWAQADNSLTLVGIGSAYAMDLVEPSRFRQAASGWRDLLAHALYGDPRVLPGVGPLLMGGFAFDPHRPSTALWTGFPAGRLVLPKLLFTRTRDSFWLTRNLVVHADSDLEIEPFLLSALLSEIIEDDSPKSSSASFTGGPSHIQAREPVPAHVWQGIVADAVQTIRRGELEKVVVARALELQATQPFDPVSALEYFSANAPGTYQFAFAHDQTCFLGATPEQLVHVRDGQLRTMGVAGSVPRGETPREDKQFGDELLASAKDRSEQEIVVRGMKQVLGDTCAELDISDTPALLKLRSIQHLVTRFQGTLANGYTVLDLVERLHPTPAVGGLPRTEALQWLAEHENLDRGWYAGAVGWIDQNFEGEFAVAIRSALLQQNRATIFAGCGIVADSDPAREYAESALKMKPMLAALNAP